jgi:hypothetical protein
MSAPTLEILKVLARSGLLLKQDKHLPSVVTLLAGEALTKSWWSHPHSQLMYRVLTELADHPDVLLTKLLLGKDTFVHRSLWPAFLAVASAREPWQLRGLSGSARALLARTARAQAPVMSAGAPVRELLSRLLVHAAEIHTPEGRHQMAVASWSSWAARAGATPCGSLEEGRQALERASHALGADHGALPWH